MENNVNFRSDCPISSALDIMGDKWSLLIIRDIMFGKKSTFKDFFSSSEKIASGILSNRLTKLEKLGLLTKSKPANNKKTNIYALTLKGTELLPIICELILWSDQTLGDHINPKMRELAKKMREDKVGFVERYTEVLKKAIIAKSP